MEKSYSDDSEDLFLGRVLENSNSVLEYVLEVADDLEDVGVAEEAHIETKQRTLWNYFGEIAIDAYSELKQKDQFTPYTESQIERFEEKLIEGHRYENLSDNPSRTSDIVETHRKLSGDQKLF